MTLYRQLKQLEGQSLLTKGGNGIPRKAFTISRVTESTIYINPASSPHIHTIQLSRLEQAVNLTIGGEKLRGPMDYKVKVADERPAYAWAILDKLGLLK